MRRSRRDPVASCQRCSRVFLTAAGYERHIRRHRRRFDVVADMPCRRRRIDQGKRLRALSKALREKGVHVTWHKGVPTVTVLARSVGKRARR